MTRPDHGGTGHFYSLSSAKTSAGPHRRAFSDWHEDAIPRKPHRRKCHETEPYLFSALVTFAALTFASNAAWANHHWGNNNGMGNRGYSQLTQEQQATVQKLHNELLCANQRPAPAIFSPNASTMRCSRRKSRTAGRLETVAQEMEGLRQKLDQQRVKFDIATAEAGVPRGTQNGIWRLSRARRRSYRHEPLIKVRSFSVGCGAELSWRPAAVESLPAPPARQCSLRRAWLWRRSILRQGPVSKVRRRSDLPFAGQHGMRGSVPASLAQDDPPGGGGVAGLAKKVCSAR